MAWILHTNSPSGNDSACSGHYDFTLGTLALPSGNLQPAQPFYNGQAFFVAPSGKLLIGSSSGWWSVALS